MNVAAVSQIAARPAVVPAAKNRAYLYGPIIDFLCLGGGSLLILIPLFLMVSPEMRPAIGVASLFANYALNQPHFAHSYQIFYRGFPTKLTSDAYPRILRMRYALSGIIVPSTMILFFIACTLRDDPKMLVLAVNVLALTVGWHYVKQGYGILMVECVLKRCFFNDREKLRLKVNAYLIWIFSWVFANVAFRQSKFFDLTFYTFDLPPWVMTLTFLLAATSTLVVICTLIQKAAATGGRLPYNGILAYTASVYVWIYAIYTDPLLMLIIPPFHAIQYMAVVWRYQLNRSRAEAGPQAAPYRLLGGSLRLPRHVARLIRFIAVGGMLSVVGFVAAPYLLTASLAEQTRAIGPGMVVIMIWIFFNVHHYFLDNVMWRKENPDVKQHLFSPA